MVCFCIFYYALPSNLHRHFIIRLHLLYDCYNALSYCCHAICNTAALQGKYEQLKKPHVLFIFLLALAYTSALGPSSNSLELSFLAILLIVAVLPLLYLSVIILHWGYTNCTFGVGVLRRLQAKRRGYGVL